eukprot:2119552-Pyramimonas_sp.AAC.1
MSGLRVQSRKARGHPGTCDTWHGACEAAEAKNARTRTLSKEKRQAAATAERQQSFQQGCCQ